MKTTIYSFSIIIMSALLFAGCYSSSQTTSGNRYSGPDWAPVYESGVRYYYFPDIETYYDVTSGNFVYLDRGQWLYSRNLPPAYRGYDLNNGYHVILDRRAYQPWRYHQDYVSSYPRYYYRNYYGNRSTEDLRGYNENNRKPVYVSPADRARRNSSTTISPSPEVNTTPDANKRSITDRRVGEPVRVSPDRREPKQSLPSSTPRETNSRRQSTSEGTGIGTSDGNVEQRRSSNTTPPPSVRRNNETPPPSETRTDSKSSSNEEKKSPRRR